ncbi:MAG: hypothetical protein J6P83_10130 [Bacteroidales bacterium]|nr:hypothetical protein [Bacteroidales bacterium]
MKRVICNTKFELNPFGDGGSKRSVQIRDLMAENGLDFEDDLFVLPKRTPKLQLMRWAIRAMKIVRRYYPKTKRGLLSYNIWLVKYYALRIPIVYDKYLRQDVVFLWENTNDKDMLYLLKATGHPVIGMPHNIESLVTNHSVEALGEEVLNLRHCDAVYAISKEETWLLRLLGVNAFFLPYYPPKEVEANLLSIRKRREVRKANVRKKILLLGSVTNPPTKKGMQVLVDFAANKSLAFDLRVAGYNTESLRIVQHPGISFLGTVTAEELDQLLVETDAVLIFQPPTTGALTRIPEMLVAGIPVFVNFDAGRNYLGMSDVHLYDTCEDLFETLENYVPYQAEHLLRDKMAESQFVKTLNNAYLLSPSCL